MTARSPRRNRVTPFGDIVAVAQRGALTGNRGALYVDGELGRRWSGRRWITCALSYKGSRAPSWGEPGRWTALYVLDEAVALAAGHRPCARCRRTRYDEFRRAWAAAFGGDAPSADAMDRRLHADRVDGDAPGRPQRRHQRSWSDLPPGAFVLLDDGRPARVEVDRAVPWTVDGWAAAVERPSRRDAVVLTPSCTVEVLGAGYSPG